MNETTMNPTQLPSRADGARVISVEYGHTVLDPTNRDAVQDELIYSAQLAIRTREELVERGFVVQTVILLDDKHMSPAFSRDEEATRLIESLPLVPDIIVFESDLKSLAPSLLAATVGSRRSQLTREIDSRAKKGLQLACSVDIAIWHLLRLGIVRSRRSTDFTKNLVPADIVVSILARREKAYEDKAFRENLSAVSRTLSERIEIIYFDPGEIDTGSDAQITAALTRIESTTIKGNRNG